MFDVRELFLLDPDVVFLNHGSFGACPRPVFEEYQRLQLELEREPVEFLGLKRRFPELIGAARERLAAYVGAAAADLVLVPNATTAVNAVARSLDLQPGDEIVATTHEYGGNDLLWRYIVRAPRRALRRGRHDAGERGGRSARGRHAANARAVRQPHLVSDGAALSRRGALRAGARGRRALDRRRRARARADRRSTSRRSVPTSTPATATSGSARPRAPAFSTCAPKPSRCSSRRPSAGTGPPTSGPTAIAGPARAIRRRTSRSRPRSTSRRSTTGTRCASAATRSPRWPRASSASGSGSSRSRRATTSSCRWSRCACRRATRRSSDGGSSREHRIEVLAQSWRGEPTLRVSFQGYNDENDLDALVEALADLL